MNLQKGISPRTTAIVGILIVLLSVGLYLYMRHDTQRFVASLPGIPTTHPVDASLSPVSFTEPISSTPETEDVSSISETEDLKETKEETKISAGASSENAGCAHAGSHTHGSEPERYGELTIDEFNDLTHELSHTNVSNLDEKFDLLQKALIDKFGPNPNIPKLIAKSKILHISDDMALTLDYSDAVQVDKYLSYEPIATAKEIVALAANVYGYGEEDIAGYMAVIQDKAKEIENIELLQETRPLIQSAIDAGDLSPKEGEAVIRASTGLNVTMHRRKNASTVNERTSPSNNARGADRTTSPKYIDLNTPDFSGD